MSYPDTKFNFSALGDADFLAKSEIILKCMEGRPDFPETIPSTAQIRTAVDDYKIAFDKASDGKKISIAKKIAKRYALETLLVRLPAYCEIATAELPFKRARRIKLRSIIAF